MSKRLLGEVNLLGLNAFGGNVSPLVGTIIGGSVTGITTMALAHIKNGAYSAHRERWGVLAGLATAGVMLTMEKTRKAAFGAAIGAVFAAGLSWMEKLLFPIHVAAAAAAGIPGTGGARIHALNGLGIPRVGYLNGLGIPSIAAQPQSVGTIPGVHGLGMRRQADGSYLNGPAFAGTQMGQAVPVSLLGNPSTRSDQISLMGGPQIHGLASAYGATLLGGR